MSSRKLFAAASKFPLRIAASPAKPKKLSPKEQKELQSLPAAIEKLDAEQARIFERMAEPDFYKKDPAKAAESKARLEAIAAELAKAYGRWEYLEDISSPINSPE